MKPSFARKAVLIILSVVIATVLVFVVKPILMKARHGDTARPATSQAPAAQKELWVCPMHPQIRSDKPGKCSICGMDLVKVEPGKEGPQESPSSAGASADHPTHGTTTTPDSHAPVTLTLERQQLIGLKTGVATKGPLFKSIQAAGRIAFDPELYTAQTEYLEALRQYQQVKNAPVDEVRHSAERMIQSARLRLKLLGLSDRQINELTAASSDSQALLLPQKGENVYVYAEIFESDLPAVRPGLSAEITAGFLAGQELAGKVMSVDRVINPTTRTARVRILVTNAKTQLRPEAYVDVRILSPLGTQVSVPLDAIFDTGRQAWVFLVGEGGKITPRLVRIQHYVDGRVAIGAGLEGGEPIVTSANFLIDSESRLQSVLTGGGADESGLSTSTPAPTPACPPGEEWHREMNHCMKKVGGK